jgi:hypothetical protein
MAVRTMYELTVTDGPRKGATFACVDGDTVAAVIRFIETGESRVPVSPGNTLANGHGEYREPLYEFGGPA